jgi:hypothetical protein
VSATVGTYLSTPATINGGRAPFTWISTSANLPS